MPAISTVVMLVILIALGTWQVERLKWKTGLIDAITAAERAPAVPMTRSPDQFTKVAATGEFRADLAALYGAEVRDTRAGSVLGGELIEPLMRPGERPLLVDRGWVADGQRAVAAVDGPATVTGYIRDGDRPGMFSATDDLKGRRFFTLDPAAIGRALGLTEVAPYTLIALGPPGGVPEPAQTLPRPPNNHFQYALTWYGFAVTLTVIFILYARKVLRHE